MSELARVQAPAAPQGEGRDHQERQNAKVQHLSLSLYLSTFHLGRLLV
jgi:hypothetical protein